MYALFLCSVVTDLIARAIGHFGFTNGDPNDHELQQHSIHILCASEIVIGIQTTGHGRLLRRGLILHN